MGICLYVENMNRNTLYNRPTVCLTVNDENKLFYILYRDNKKKILLKYPTIIGYYCNESIHELLCNDSKKHATEQSFGIISGMHCDKVVINYAN